MYEKLVENDQDLVGMIAYSIYKKHKQEFIKNYKKENNQKNPSTSKLQPFHTSCQLEFQLRKYRDESTTLVSALTNEIINLKKEEIKTILGTESKTKQFWLGVLQSLVASLIWVLIIAIIAFILWSMEHSPFDAIKSIINKENIITK